MFLTAKEAAVRLHISPSAIYALCGSGELKHYRFGKRIRVEEADLAAYIEAHCKHVVPQEVQPPRKPGLKPGGFALLRAAGFVPKGKFEVGVG